MTDNKILIIICILDPPERFYHLVEKLLLYNLPILIVDDGSHYLDKDRLAHESINIIRHRDNQGKGKSLMDGFQYALNQNFNWALTIDGDYQHIPEDIPKFINQIKEDRYDLIIGNRLKKRVEFPGKNYYANLISSKTLSFLLRKRINDAQCGFRAYRISMFNYFQPVYHDFAFETEVIIHAVRHSFKIHEIDIDIRYYTKKEKVSHFRPVRDFTIISIKALYTIIKLKFYHDKKK